MYLCKRNEGRAEHENVGFPEFPIALQFNQHWIKILRFVETYDQIPISSAAIGDSLKFVKENEMCKICSHNGNVFAVEPPLFVELVITECEPGVKGDTATGATKPCTVETGAQVSVPLFVNEGDTIKIDTRTGEYLSRV